MVEFALQQAIALDFSHYAKLDVTRLEFLSEVRDMCAANKCNMYNKSWVCPPACGDLSVSVDQASAYTEGILVQTTGTLDDVFDYSEMKDIGKRHSEKFRIYIKTLKEHYPDLLALGSGACSLCSSCSYPEEPCRNPNEAVSSMEAYGLFVSKVCSDNNLGYYYGEGTITYTSCALLI